MSKQLTNIMQELDFPAEAQTALLSAWERLTADKTVAARLAAMIELYETQESCDLLGMLDEIKAMGAACGVSAYVAHLLLLLALCDGLKEKYRSRGLSESLYAATVRDLTNKLHECYLVYGEWGVFVADWMIGYFELTRFTLGRLQFERMPVGVDCVVDGVAVSKDMLAINVHIPRTGERLDYDVVRECYDRAVAFFKDELCKPIVFMCHSWLLYSWNQTVLSPQSNLAKFAADYTLVEQRDYDDYSEVWRLFDCRFTGDLEALPADTSFRRAYIERMRSGGKTGDAKGVFIYRK
ncbi:MAG: DUF5596 domain-containing protein [Clostridia bacterium]|nr:DUF5596 domain-containing protein [Clostridia bacterium]